MILTGNKIDEEVNNKKIIIEPYDKDCLNPNSYNFHLGDTFFIYKNKVLDPKVEQPTRKLHLGEKGMILQPGELYLGHTQEVMGSDFFAPFIFGRSSVGRLGIFVQINAPLGDIGFKGKWTLQITPVRPVRVYPGMKIGQIFFLKPEGEITLYNGKYQNSKIPRKSEIYKDFNNK